MNQYSSRNDVLARELETQINSKNSVSSSHSQFSFSIAGIQFHVSSSSSELISTLSSMLSHSINSSELRGKVSASIELYSSMEEPFFAEELKAEESPLSCRALLQSTSHSSVKQWVQWWSSRVLLDHGVTLIEGSAVIRGERGYVFYGGKAETHRKLLEHLPKNGTETKILEREQVLIGFIEGEVQPRIYSSWVNSDGESQSIAKLTRIYRLDESGSESVSEIRPLNPARSVETLLDAVIGLEESQFSMKKFELICRFCAYQKNILSVSFRSEDEFWSGLFPSEDSSSGKVEGV